MKPFNVFVDFTTGELRPGKRVVRRLSDVKYIFQNQEAAEAMLREGDPLVYEVIYAEIPEEPGHLAHCTTIIYPGKVGQEFFLTKGHLHEKLDTAEIYFCLRGEGRLIMASPEGECEVLPMYPGTASYIPPFWSHRSVNVGKEPLIFYCIFPADAGHDYATIEETGFPRVVLEEDGRVVVRENPKWKPKK
ncbi:glucose-6-phosphate isomerase [Candidatus Caldatribacterium sp. SIUC1]|uniref:glucose-6-phosphate isomerase n=1 Tax=Candidatus Caldatribacterium sp. SIUC1 TaxID=3418365 RepID=UPI003F694477